jgi:hypothetical protein
MAAKLITYDLNKPGRDYDDLHNAIKKLGSWWHCLESTWIVDSTKAVSEIRDTLKAHIDSNDDLAVFSLSGGWATYGLSDKCNNWLRNHL